MSVDYVQGNLLEWPADINVIVHGCNALGRHGRGFAKRLKERYPEAAASYRAWCEEASGGAADLGTFHVTPVDGNARRIVHLVTQFDTGTDRRRLNYEALHSGLEALKQLLETAAAEGRHWVLGMPQWIGCGLAGGAASIVQAHVEHLFFQSPVRCVVVEKTT